jgi:uncharacterized membrane protein YhaH (DUF805 family)
MQKKFIWVFCELINLQKLSRITKKYFLLAIDINYAKNLFVGLQDGYYLDAVTQIGSISGIIFLVVCMALNIATLAIYRRRMQGMTASAATAQPAASNGGKEAIEKKLLVYAILTFVGHMLIAILMVRLGNFL